MSSFLNGAQLSELRSIFQSHFEQFSSGIGNFVSIVKQPISVISNYNSDVFAGFGNESTPLQNISYQAVSGVFPAIIIYPKMLQTKQFVQLKFNLDENEIIIKLDINGHKYMDNGKTEKLLVNGTFYNTEDTPTLQNYYGLRYWYYKLKSTN